jgi:hypothetical protein
VPCGPGVLHEFKSECRLIPCCAAVVESFAKPGTRIARLMAPVSHGLRLLLCQPHEQASDGLNREDPPARCWRFSSRRCTKGTTDRRIRRA